MLQMVMILRGGDKVKSLKTGPNQEMQVIYARTPGLLTKTGRITMRQLAQRLEY